MPQHESHPLSLALVRGCLALVGVVLKRPSFQFYPGDWRKDVQLRACSLAARGLWVDLMCVMHECEPYGHLMINGRSMNAAQISGQIGVPAAQVKRLIDELLENGVARQTEEGAIYSKRMVEDERIRNARAEGGKAGSEHGHKGAQHGSKGGRPVNQKGGLETPLTGDEITPLRQKEEPPKEPPPSSSSSSSSSNTPPNPQGGCVRFGEFWAAWPKSDRKAAKGECEKLWVKAKLDTDAEAILAHVQHMAKSSDWLRDGGAYIPAPLVYLRGKRWDGADIGDQTESIFAGGV